MYQPCSWNSQAYARSRSSPPFHRYVYLGGTKLSCPSVQRRPLPATVPVDGFLPQTAQRSLWQVQASPANHAASQALADQGEEFGSASNFTEWISPCVTASDSSDLPAFPELRRKLGQLTPSQLARAAQHCARRSIRLTKGFLDDIAQQIHRKLKDFKSPELSAVLWTLAVYRHEPEQQWWDEFERQVYNNLTEFSDKELANLLWGFAVLNQRQTWLLDSLLVYAADNFASYSADSLHLILWSLAWLKYTPSAEWIQSYLAAAQSKFFQLTPSQMTNIIWALAVLGVKLPSMWVDSFLMAAQWRFPSFSPKLLSIIVWSTAKLNHRPSHEWLGCFEQQSLLGNGIVRGVSLLAILLNAPRIINKHKRQPYWIVQLREKLTDFTGHQLASIAWALRSFGYTSEHNTVFYLLEKQHGFLESDFEILANSKLLTKVLDWKKGLPAGP